MWHDRETQPLVRLEAEPLARTHSTLPEDVEHRLFLMPTATPAIRDW
jgi:hypothetical protein